jgi:YD repeat-containing protein
VALLKSRTVVRAGSSQTYATVNTYDERPYRADRASNFNDFGRPKEALETGELTRRTSRTFFYGTGADPSFTTFIADKTASETVEVGGESFTSSWKYEAATGFTKSQTINGITTTFSRDDYGNVASATDANGNKTRYTYEWGVVKDTLRPEYDITREINRDGTVKSETRRGFKTGFEYDQLSRLILTDPPLGNSVVTEYDNATGRLTRVTRGPSVLTSETNGFGQPIKTANSLRVTTVTTYDACGRPVYQSYPFYEEGPTPNIGPRPSTTRWAAPPGASIPTARSCASSTPA